MSTTSALDALWDTQPAKPIAVPTKPVRVRRAAHSAVKPPPKREHHARTQR
jgi:hypothetical protein